MFETVRELWESLSEMARLATAAGGAVTATASVYAVARAALPRLFRRREDSAALTAALASLNDGKAVWTASDGKLCAGGLIVKFDDHRWVSAIHVGDAAHLADVLPGGERGREYRRARRAAYACLASVIERDRLAACADAARALDLARAK